jgi:hypothetical protein
LELQQEISTNLFKNPFGSFEFSAAKSRAPAAYEAGTDNTGKSPAGGTQNLM